MNIDVLENYSEKNLLLRLDYITKGERTFVDVGAEQGSFSRAFAKRGWRVIAFEPEPINYRYCSHRLKKFPKAICIQKAISNVSMRKVPFFVSSDHPGIHSLKPFHPTHSPSITIDTVRLDEVLSTMKIDQVTALKIDIEGADFLALESFDFSKYKPEVVMVEFMDERSQSNFGYNHHDMAAYMARQGYSTFVSEWSPIIEYAHKNRVSSSHGFLQCDRYPLDHEPASGNLIFIPGTRVTQFERALSSYLNDLERYKRFRIKEGLRKLLGRIPGSKRLVYALRRL